MWLINPFRVIYKYRKIIKSTTIADLKAKFAGSLLGTFWIILYPLLLLTAYSFVYIFVLQVRFGQMSTPEYIMLIFSGLIPFLGFTEGLAASVVSVSSNSSLIKNTLFPIDIIPVKAVIISQCTQVVGMIILIITLIVSKNLTPYALLILPIWFCQMLFGIGLGWIVSCLNVYFKDLQNIISLITLFLMMISPIAYTVDMVPVGLKPFLSFNPLYYFITAYQDSLVIGCFPRDNVFFMLIVISLIMFIVGYWFFSKMKQVFADNV